MSEEEAALARFLITRYREASAAPGPKTQDALANALTVALRRVRGALEVCFADPDLEAAVRRELLVMYSGLDRWMDGFKLSRGEASTTWLSAAEGLIHRLEAAYAMAEKHRPESAREALGVRRNPNTTLVEFAEDDDDIEDERDIEDDKTASFVRRESSPPTATSPTTERYS